MGLLDTASGRGGFAGGLGGELLAGSLASGRLAGGLLGAGHCLFVVWLLLTERVDGCLEERGFGGEIRAVI